LTAKQVIDLYFVEHRAKLLDLAGFLDRVERAGGAAAVRTDYRLEALRRALTILGDRRPQRARRVLELLSDPTTHPRASAAGLKPAAGAYQPVAADHPTGAPRRRSRRVKRP
jgi:hypothetical protein